MAIKIIVLISVFVLHICEAWHYVNFVRCSVPSTQYGQTDLSLNTYEGYDVITKLGKMRLVVSHSFNVFENSYECFTFDLDWDANPRTWHITYKNSSGSPFDFSGEFTVRFGPPATVITMTNVPRDHMLMADLQNVAYMFPMWVSETELVLMCCYDYNFGSYRTLYAFTNLDFNYVDPTCSTQQIKHYGRNIDFFSDQFFFYKNYSSCTPLAK